AVSSAQSSWSQGARSTASPDGVTPAAVLFSDSMYDPTLREPKRNVSAGRPKGLVLVVLRLAEDDQINGEHDYSNRQPPEEQPREAEAQPLAVPKLICVLPQ